MDLYDSTLALLLASPLVSEWPELQALLRRVAASRPRDWRLPVIAGKAVGGTTKQVLPAVAALACMQVSIILIDDLLDEDPRGEYRRIGAPATANLASAVQALGLAVLQSSDTDPMTLRAAMSSLLEMMTRTALGQQRDTENPSDEEGYWQVVHNKSAPFFGTALHTGALLGGSSPEVAEQLRALGHLYGEMIQIHDDFNDTMAEPANPDWMQGRAPLPILFAQTVEHPERERFLQLKAELPDPAALIEAQAILLRCGAVSYSIHQLLHRHQAATNLLAAPPPQRFRGIGSPA
jgi:geranylgeranyl pyrophosphate synthase